MALVSVGREELAAASPGRRREWSRQLEAGDILLFPDSPTPLLHDDLEFLLVQQQTASGLHKNIAYKPRSEKLSGISSRSGSAAASRLSRILAAYSSAAHRFLLGLTPYAAGLELDYASYRPQEERGRELPLRRRNDLLHIDAFPTRPTQGARILRYFLNLHPSRSRDWVTGEPFAAVVGRFTPVPIPLPTAEPALLRCCREAARRSAPTRALGRALATLAPALERSPYDAFMMRLHNVMKEDAGYQQSAARLQTAFPPGSSWLVYTETVPHAVLAGQFALEQTFLVRPDVLVTPQSAPLRILERMAGARLA